MVNVIVSSAGVQGPAGNTILSGEGAPGSGVGVDGDFYADITEYPTSLTLYGPKAGAWPEQGIVLSGADGAVMSVNGQTGEVTITAAGIEALAAANNLSDLASPAAARTNLGLGGAAILNVGTSVGTVAAGNDARITGAAQTANNLSDLQSAPAARTNLGLGSAATQASSAFDASGAAATAQSNAEAFTTSAITALDLGGASQLNVGTGAGTVAAGNDTRITGALQAANNLADLTSETTARTSLGLGAAAVANIGTTTGTVASGTDTRITGALQASNNLSDIGSPPTARTNLGLAAGATAAAASTVASASSYGQSTVVGTDTTYAREDHSHGTPALTTTAPGTTLGIGQSAALGSATLPALADHVHPLAAAGAPAASAVTSTQTAGVATTFAASDHVHAREGFGAPTAQTTFGAASTTGTATTVPHSDHAHGTPTLPTATTGAAGIVQLDGTATDIQALGAQAAGASGLAADAQHVHPTTGLVTGVTAADTSIVVAGTSGAPTVRTATLDVIATQHPPAAAWSNASHNITHVANGSASSDAAAFGQIPLVGTLSQITLVSNAQTAGSTGQYADAGHTHSYETGWIPADNNLLAANYDPQYAGTTWLIGSSAAAVPQVGIVFLNKFIARKAFTWTNFCYGLAGNAKVSGSAGGTTAGENWLGIYNSSGTLLTTTADQSSVYTGATGTKIVAWNSTVSITAGSTYFLACLFNGSWDANTLSFKATGAGVTTNIGLVAPNLRYSNMLTGQTTLPSTLTLSSQTTTAIGGSAGSHWFGAT